MKCSKANGRPCKAKSHAGHTEPCTEWATNGPDNSRIYCSQCTTQLKLKATHPPNSQKCLDCGKFAKHKIGTTKDMLCMTCVNKRSEVNPDQDIKFANGMCEECGKVSASRAPTSEDQPRRCVSCSPPDWESTTNKNRVPTPRIVATEEERRERQKLQHQCPHEGCEKIKQMGYQLDGKRRVCPDHVSDLDVRENDPVIRYTNARKCEAHNRVARFGFSESTHCHECRTPDMKKLSKLCEVEGCEEDPRLGIRDRTTGKGKAIRCTTHEEKGDVEAGKILCQYQDEEGLYQCDTRAGYGKTKTEFCAQHKRDDDVELSHTSCEVIGCKVRPIFGHLLKRPLRCDGHKLDGMEDVVSVKCKAEGCSKNPSWGFEGGKATHCKSHKVDGMRDVKSKRCEYEGCDVFASFGTSKAIYCKAHRLPGMKCIRAVLCVLCQMTQVSPLYKPNCTQCYFYLHPDDARIRNYKTKEQAFMVPLKEYYSDMVLDKSIDGGCSKRRPDGFIDCLTHSVIVEIDEDEHIGYDDMCENRRIMELYLDAALRPIVFVRLNPDGYRRDGKKIDSIFKKTKTGELKCNKCEFERRFTELKAAVDNAIVTIPTKSITVIHLCFTDVTE